MNDKKIFELTGINAIKEIEFEVKEEIADTIANLLAREFEKLNYREVKAKFIKNSNVYSRSTRTILWSCIFT